MADYGLKISANGEDVKTTADKELVFTSSASNLKLKAQGTATLTLTAGTNAGTATIAHGLAYRPWHQTFTEILGKRYNSTYLQITQFDFVGEPFSGVFLSSESDTTNIYVKIFTGGGLSVATYNFSVYYYIALDTGSA